MLVETLSGVSQKPRHVLDVLRFYANERGRLDAAQEVIGGSADQLRRIMREADALLLTNPERLTEAPDRGALFRAWTNVLLEAAARIEREDGWGELYAAEPSDDTFAAASASRAGSTWPKN